MLAKVYISSFDLWAARHVRDVLRRSGHAVVSTWHEPGSARGETPEEWAAIIGRRNDLEIREADCLVLIATKADVPGGKFVEAGIALGAGKRVYILGHVENRLLHHSRCVTLPTPEEVAEAIAAEGLSE